MRKAVGVDLGGTKINVLLVDDQGKVLERDKQPTESEKGKDHVINKIKSMIDNVLNQAGLKITEIEGIGIGFPGLMDRDKKTTLYAPNLGDEWKKEVLLGKELEETFNVPVYLENDVNLIAWAEWLVGAGRGTKTMICVALGTGIGSGIVLNGKLWIGAHGMAGEFGHTTVLPDGPVCGCGNRGCIEAIASGTGIEKYAKSILPQYPNSLIWELCNGNLDEVTVKIIYQAAERGDKLAVDIFNYAGYYLGIALANYVHIIDPEKIVIGGGVANVREYIGKPMKEEFYKRVLPSFRDKVTFSWAELGEDAGGIGAALLVLYR
ncbi:MAG: ROK family protein [Dictyoglomus thermophilum]|nr:ROK family protein [Dictyoglomus thermophilum]MCX7720986.1 ROK family protein [Dictyoglomus thermophilum]